MRALPGCAQLLGGLLHMLCTDLQLGDRFEFYFARQKARNCLHCSARSATCKLISPSSP